MCLGCNDPGGPARCPADTLATVEAKTAARDGLLEQKRQIEAELALIEHGLLESDPDQLREHLERTESDRKTLEWELGVIAEKEPAAPASSGPAPDFQSMSEQELRAAITDRTTSDEYLELLAARDAARERMAGAQANFDAASAAVADSDPETLEALRLARNTLHDTHCDHVVAYTDLDAYKNATAGAVAELSSRLDLPTWQGQTLGQAGRLDTPDGTREWLAAQQDGIRGDEVGVIIGEDTFGWTTPTAIKNSKLAPITDADVEAHEIASQEHSGPAGRARAWKKVIVDEYACDHPDDTVMLTSGTWRNPDYAHLNVNVDAVLARDGENPDGILLSKTVSDASRFDDGIPPSYRAQLASQLRSTGLERGVLAVKIDDRDTRYFTVAVDDPINGQPGGKTIADYDGKLADTWSKWSQAKADPVGPRPNKSTFSWTKNPSSASSLARNETIAADLAAYRGISRDRATKLITDGIYQGKSGDQAVRDLYATYDPASHPNRRYVTLDFETSARSAGKGEVIQTGVVVTDGKGNVLERIDELHGIDPRIRSTQGTGQVGIHGITPPMVEDKPPFQQSAAYSRVKELLSDPRCSLVAHNAQFEKTWLRANGIGTTRVIDTMRLRQRFDHGTVGSTNADFCAANGVEYLNGHNAAADADMTSRALHGFMRRLFSTPK